MPLIRYGDTIRLTSFEHLHPDGTKFTFKANPKGTKKKDKKVFVAILIGVEDMDLDGRESMDPADYLKLLGWQPPK
jgi:hypothetical protein